MGNLFLYLTVFVLLSFHSFIFPHVFIEHVSERVLLLMVGFKEDTELQICTAVCSTKTYMEESQEGDHETVKCAHLHPTPETYRNYGKSFGRLCDWVHVNFTICF